LPCEELKKGYQSQSRLRQSRQLAEASGTPTILAWMASMEAEAYANLREEHMCLKVLGQAERLTDRSGVEEDAHKIKFDYARFAGYKGVCYLRLRQPDAALIALNEGNNTKYGALSVRQRSIHLVDSAAAHNQLGEIEEACRLATQALMMTDQTKSLLVTQRLLDFRQSIKKQWEASHPVEEFDTQLVLRGVLPA
jgi:tetratricopeptide (TPR) repeat protein